MMPENGHRAHGFSSANFLDSDEIIKELKLNGDETFMDAGAMATMQLKFWKTTITKELFMQLISMMLPLKIWKPIKMITMLKT